MKYLIPLLSLASLTACSEPDKQMHFAAGAVTSGVVTHLTGSPTKGCVAAIGVGVAKELFDSRFGGTADSRDAIATGAGCALWTIKW